MTIIIIIAICILLLIVFWLYKKLKNRPKTNKKPKEKKPKLAQTTFKNVNLTVNENYMVRKQVLFWKFLNLILPKEYIVVPKVALSDLLTPDGDKKIFNLIIDKTLDYVIFNEKTMYPALVIDIYDKLSGQANLSEQDPFLVNILNNLNLKVLHILVSANFDRENAKKEIYQALNINIQNDD